VVPFPNLADAVDDDNAPAPGTDADVDADMHVDVEAKDRARACRLIPVAAATGREARNASILHLLVRLTSFQNGAAVLVCFVSHKATGQHCLNCETRLRESGRFFGGSFETKVTWNAYSSHS
jgi:hypothetical protein